MEKYIKEFPQQLYHAVEIAQEIKLEKIDIKSFGKIVICGLGGSGIGATIIKNIVSPISSFPIEVVKDYNLPAFVDDETLVILCSYSGTTEETVSCLEQAIDLQSSIIIISSGGEIIERAQNNGLDRYQIPCGYQPRAALGYSLVMLFNIFHQIGVFPYDVNTDLRQAADYLTSEKENIQHKALELAQSLLNKLPILYTETLLEGIAIRWRQQINENSKMLSYHHVIPEMNHNELVALKNMHPQMHFVLIRHDQEHPKNSKRFNFVESQMNSCQAPYSTVYAQGRNEIEKVLFLIHLGDWLSHYLADLQQVDSMEVKIIDELKSFISE